MYSMVWLVFRGLEVLLSPLHTLLSRTFGIAPDRNDLNLGYGALELVNAVGLVTLSVLLLSRSLWFLAAPVLLFGAVAACEGISKSARRSIRERISLTAGRRIETDAAIDHYNHVNAETDGVCRVGLFFRGLSLIVLGGGLAIFVTFLAVNTLFVA